MYPYNVYGQPGYNVYGHQEIVGHPGYGQAMVPSPPAFVGAGLEQIIGAILNPASAQGAMADPAAHAALMQRMAGAQPMLQQVQPTAWRKWSTGLGPVRVAAGGTGTVTITPQLLFKVKKLYLTDQNDAGVGAGYASSVTGITVGQSNQLPNNTQMPTWAFGPGTLENAVDWDTCQGAYTMTLTFSATYACTITGALFGLAVKNS